MVEAMKKVRYWRGCDWKNRSVFGNQTAKIQVP